MGESVSGSIGASAAGAKRTYEEAREMADSHARLAARALLAYQESGRNAERYLSDAIHFAKGWEVKEARRVELQAALQAEGGRMLEDRA